MSKNTEHMVAIVSFDGAVRREAKRVREALRPADLSEFSLVITASGRVQDGELKIEYALADNTYGSRQVTGDTVNAVLDEFLRRHGWTKVHQPLAISGPADDEIPF